MPRWIGRRIISTDWFDHPEIVDILFGQDAPPGFVDTIWAL